MENFSNYITELYKPDKLDRIINKIEKTPNLIKMSGSGAQDYMPREMIRRYVAKFGIQHLGDGIYGNVFSIPGYPWVIKIWSVEDHGYPRWLDFIKKYKGNPYVPVVKGAPVKIGSRLLAVRLETLMPMTFEEWRVFNKHMISVERGTAQNPELLKLMKGFNMYDLHSENIMLRPSTMHPVITDPAS